jgi:hypothetical protein
VHAHNLGSVGNYVNCELWWKLQLYRHAGWVAPTLHVKLCRKDTETEKEYVHEKAVLTILKDRRRHMKRETEERKS